jgi:hypothetical protein
MRRWGGDSPLEAHAERLVPDPQLPAARGTLKR